MRRRSRFALPRRSVQLLAMRRTQLRQMLRAGYVRFSGEWFSDPWGDGYVHLIRVPKSQNRP